ncbi:MAG TPA: hypothetical protein VGI96_35720, partial [Streptosporangiaceae bacterium]
ILEESPEVSGDPPAADRPAPLLAADVVPWMVSGRTPAGLAAPAGRLAAYLAGHDERDPADVAWSLATSRSVFEHRAVVTGAGREQLAADLAAVPGTAWRVWRRWRPVRSRRAVRAGWCSCSPARAPSGPAWAGSWRRPRRSSRRGWLSAPGRWPRMWAGICWT